MPGKYRVAIAAIVLSVIAMPQMALSQSGKQADIRRLMEVTNASQLAQQMANNLRPLMERQIKVGLPKMPLAARELWMDEVEQGFRAKIPELMEQIMPIYGREFTHEEIKGLLAFYETPLGRKAIETLPGILRESTKIGQRWGGELGRRLGIEAMEKVREAGFDPNTFK